MNFNLLKNNVYLTLLAFYNGKKMPNYIELGNQSKVTRQTASKKVKELLEEGIIKIEANNILYVDNIMNIDVNLLSNILTNNPNINILELKEQLFGESTKDIVDLAEELNISRSSVYHYKNSKIVVYGIVSEGVIKYIGSTKCYEERIKQHILKRPFLTQSNFIILKEIVEDDRFCQEKELIHIIQPEWNIMSKEF